MIRNKVFARVGELIQGKLSPMEYFIIPGLMSNEFYTETFIDVIPVGEELKPIAKDCVKLYELVKAGKDIDVLRQSDLSQIPTDSFLEQGYFITQVSNIPFGKGFTSNSADCLSVLHSVNLFYDSALSTESLYEIASIVAVVDPCLEVGIAQIFDPIRGKRIFHLPEVNISGLFFDSDLESINHPKHMYDLLNYSELEIEQFNYLMEFYQQGLIINDLNPIFEATWKSVQINQLYNPKKKIDNLKEFADANQVGVFVSHVGSYMGIYGRPGTINDIENEFIHFVKSNWDETKIHFATNESTLLGV